MKELTSTYNVHNLSTSCIKPERLVDSVYGLKAGAPKWLEVHTLVIVEINLLI